jgi:hypothetical protein
MEDGQIVKGCGYERADALYKKLANEYLKKYK